MNRNTVFVKVSGDLYKSPAFIKKIKEIHPSATYMAVCVGGGTQINSALKKAGFKVGKHGPLGRELKTNEERRIAKEVLDKNVADLRIRLNAIGLRQIGLYIPVVGIESIICHINGDQFVKMVYNGFDQLFIFTKKDRVVKKAEEFSNLPKVQVIGL